MFFLRNISMIQCDIKTRDHLVERTLCSLKKASKVLIRPSIRTFSYVKDNRISGSHELTSEDKLFYFRKLFHD